MGKAFFLLLLVPFPLLLLAQELEDRDLVKFFTSLNNDTLAASQAFNYLEEHEEEYGIRMYSPRHIVSTDEKLEVFQFEGESCGAYCNPLDYSIIKVSGDSVIYIETEFSFSVDSVSPINDSVYFAFGEGSARPRGIEGIWGKALAVVHVESIRKEELQVIRSYTSNLAVAEDTESDEPEVYMEFFPETNQLHCTYDWYDESAAALKITKHYLFNGTRFIEITD